MPRTAKTALDAFISRKSEFDALLERLAELSEAHFNTDPDKVTWGHVGTLGKYIHELTMVTNDAFREGECAE